jgi:hypothetical protein
MTMGTHMLQSPNTYGNDHVYMLGLDANGETYSRGHG